MDKTTKLDNRHFTRITKPLVIRFNSLSTGEWKTFTGTCRNISEGGAFIEADIFCDGMYMPQDKIHLSIFLSDWNDKIDAMAEVIWQRRSNYDSQRPGAGLKFIYLSPVDRVRLSEYISESKGLHIETRPIKINITTVVKQKLPAVIQLIRNMEKFPVFISDIQDIITLEKEENRIVNEWKLKVEDIILEWTQENIFLPDKPIVRFKMLSGDFKAFYGEWRLLQLLTGTRIELAVTLECGMPVLERLLGNRLTKTIYYTLEGMLRAIKKKMWVPKVKKLLKFAAVIHPLDLRLFSTYEAGAKYRREIVINKLLEWTSPFEYAPITGIKSLNGKAIDGELILCPLLPQQIINLKSSFVLNKIIEAGHIAEKIGAKIFSLTAYTAQVGKKGVMVAKALKIPVTTGTSYTIAAGIDGVLNTAAKIGIDINKSKITIIGATGNIGSICAEFFSDIVEEIHLVARNQTRLSRLAEKIKRNSHTNVYIDTDINRAVSIADIIITATNTPQELINIDIVQPGTLIYDISLPKNVSKDKSELRKDFLVIDGGVIHPPGNPNFNLYYGLPLDLTYACIAEAMILTLEERFESYSIGGNVSLEKVKEISYLGHKHGFQLAELRSFGKSVSPQDIERVKTYYLQRKFK